MKSCILFDLDGTLVDSAPSITRSLNVALEEHGYRAIKVDDVRPLLGNDARELIGLALDAQGQTPSIAICGDIAARFLDIYRGDPVAGSALYPGCMDVLAECRQFGYTLAICTNKPTLTAMPVIDQMALAPHFDAVVCGDQAAFKKPDGRHILQILDDLNCPPRDAVMVGDAANDVAAANDAGVKSVLVDYGYDPEGGRAHGPTETLSRLVDLPDMLDALIGR